MKKKLFCLLFALLLTLLAAGCGMNRTGDTGKDMLPDAGSMTSPDRDDGVVRDQDGIIGNGDKGGLTPSPSASPMPSASPAPSVSPMPTTAPSASPKP
jgi:hypothetical protein